MWRAALGLALLAIPATSKAPTLWLLDLAEGCDLAVHGAILERRGDTAVVEVKRAWKAAAVPGSIVVTPVAIHICMERPLSLAVGEEAVLFLSGPAGGPYVVLGASQGKLALPDGESAERVAAVDRLFTIAALDEDGRSRAMLALATSEDPILRRESHVYIAMRISHSNLRERYKADLLTLLGSEDADVRRAALEGLANLSAPEAVETYIALTRDTDPGVAQTAGCALSRYDTDAAVAAIAGLARHENRHVRKVALIYLRQSRKPQAREAFLLFLDDPDPAIRKLACDWVTALLHDREQKDITAQVGRLLAQARDPEVRAEAARLAYETQDAALIDPLARALQEAEPGGALETACLESLRDFHIYGGEAGKRAVGAHLELIRRSARGGTGGRAPVEILVRAGDFATVRRAAIDHPDAQVREFARRSLAAR